MKSSYKNVLDFFLLLVRLAFQLSKANGRGVVASAPAVRFLACLSHLWGLPCVAYSIFSRMIHYQSMETF